MKPTLSSLAVVLLLSNCGLIESHHLTGSYYLAAENVPEDMKVIYNSNPGARSSHGRIRETVFAVGWDDRYIVAMQHPQNNKRVTNFYYLDISRDSEEADPRTSVVGPLGEAAFKRKKAELGLPDFRRVIESLE